MMVAESTSEISANVYQTTQRNNAETAIFILTAVRTLNLKKPDIFIMTLFYDTWFGGKKLISHRRPDQHIFTTHLPCLQQYHGVDSKGF
jgi:hypothetical protein